MHPVKLNLIRSITLTLPLCVAALCGVTYYTQYFKWRGCFNEMGRCFNAKTGIMYLQQSGTAWLLLTIGAVVVALYQLWRMIR
ncbi:MAG: hypothetical protein ACJAXK_000568 [Yoonia sp.]|jgi:hypothetical protein